MKKHAVDASGRDAERLASFGLRRQMAFARRGLFWALLSGITWGVVGVLLGLALSMPPFAALPGGSTALWGLLCAPLAGACLHDSFAALWLLSYNLGTGAARSMRAPRVPGRG